MILSGNITEINQFLKDIVCSDGEKVSAFVKRFKASDVLQRLVRDLYPTININIRS